MPLFQIREADTPIIKYRIGHTTPKAQSGGLNDGFDKSAYQVLTESIVVKDPRKPVNRQTETEHISLPIAFISDFSLILFLKRG
jgi:hypothetical protein